MNSGKNNNPPAPTRVSVRIIARVKPTIAMTQSNKSTICTSTEVATSASGSAFAIDLIAEEEEPELAATNFQIQASTALAMPPSSKMPDSIVSPPAAATLNCKRQSAAPGAWRWRHRQQHQLPFQF